MDPDHQHRPAMAPQADAPASSNAASQANKSPPSAADTATNSSPTAAKKKRPRRHKGKSSPTTSAQPTAAEPPRASQAATKHAPQLFEPYYDAARLAAGLSSGTLVRGVLRVNSKNRTDAYVALDQSPSARALERFPFLETCAPGNGNDLYVCGPEDRNRAMAGDIVAVRILGRTQAAASYRKHRMADDRRMDHLRSERRARLKHMAHSTGAAQPASKAPSDEGGVKVPEMFCAVVGVLAANTDCCFAGTLSHNVPSAVRKHPRFAASLDSDSVLWFVPDNNGAPCMMVAAADVPESVRSDAEKRALVVVRMDRWEETSPLPHALFVKALGSRGSLETETALILADCGVRTEPFDAATLACLPQVTPAQPWTIPPAELQRRTDLRTSCIFTIDPSSARDLDDAVSCGSLPNGNVLMGVHIADVSHFVRPGTALDTEARARATTTYMVQRAYPMLPPLLCENLCSLGPGIDRLAFSVMWEMDPRSATVLSTWFGRTIIHSACKLSYDDAQYVIDSGHLPDHVALHQALSDGQRVAASALRRREVENSILWLHHLAVLMRRRRFAQGALSLSSTRLSFDLDPDGRPVSCQPYELKASNRLIEEFMLLANMSVAARIEATFPKAALLRRHSPPLLRRLEETCRLLANSGIDIDPTSAKTIQASLDRISDQSTRSAVENILTGPMQRAMYFSTGAIDNAQEYAHYALNVPRYTHFTSPIRRYADVIVHRTLEASLALYGDHVADRDHPLLPEYYSPYFPPPVFERPTPRSVQPLVPHSDDIANIAHICNLRKDAAKKAQEASIQLYLAHYLDRMTRNSPSSPIPGILTPAVVTKIKPDCLVVTLSHFGIESTIYMDRMADKKKEVVATDGRSWALKSWSVDLDSVTLTWDAKPSKSSESPDDLASKFSALVIDEEGQDSVSSVKKSSRSTLGFVQVLHMFDNLTVCINPALNPPSVNVKLAMPSI
ncbi:hypothetical protein GGI07_001553 [Coemansia sp. Benny D115]|nr:hypothetical protein GGI07_001553 [Coemansia sp. Benny D115]